MKVCFDGMRKNATAAMNDLYIVVEDIMNLESNEEVDADMKERLADRWNSAANMMFSFNCISYPNVWGDMNNLSHLKIKKFEEETA